MTDPLDAVQPAGHLSSHCCPLLLWLVGPLRTVVITAPSRPVFLLLETDRQEGSRGQDEVFVPGKEANREAAQEVLHINCVH